MSENVLPGSAPETYTRIARPWLDLGYAVIPTSARAVKKPGIAWWPFCGDGDPPKKRIQAGEVTTWPGRRWSRRAPEPEELAEWAEVAQRRKLDAGLLLLDSQSVDLPDLVVVEADASAWDGWIDEEFGVTPFTVRSGRDDAGRHHYFRVPRGLKVPSSVGCIGPAGSFVWDENTRRWKSKVDVKGHRSYVVAPGSRHKTGRLYTASGPISRDVIASLPEFPLGKYEALLDDWRRMPKPSQSSVVVAISNPPNTPSKATSPRTSRYESKAGDPTLPIPSPTPGYAGRLPLDVAAEVGTGSQVEIGCPFHASVSGRSATLRVSDGGHVSVSCHVEQVTYSLGWLTTAVDAPDDADAIVDTILESISAMPTIDASAPSAFPPPEPLPLHKVTERVGALSSVVAPSLLDPLRDCERQVPDTAVGADVEDAARERATDLGAAAVYCVRGPYQHAADDRGRASTSRLACLSYTCSSCGPHVLVVLRAAAEVVVERIVNWRMPARADTWFGCVAEDLPQSAARALQRWAATEDDDAVGVSAPEPSREWRLHNERPPERMYVTIAQSPKLTSTLVMWHGAGNAPTGALAKHLSDGRPIAADDLSAMTGEMVAAVDREAWALVDARATVLRGSTFLTERIADLRDRVLGRARAKRQKTRPMTFAVRSYRDGERVRRELSNRLQVGMKLDGTRIEPMKRRLVEHWSADDAEASPSVRREMERMKDEGWFEGDDPVELPRVEEVGVLDDLLGKHLTASVEDDRVLRVGRKLGVSVCTPQAVQQVARHLLAEHVYAGMADCCGPNPPIARRVNGVPVGGSVVGAEAVNQLADEMNDLDHPLGRLPVADDHVLVYVFDLAPGMSVRRVQAAILFLTEVPDRAFAA